MLDCGRLPVVIQESVDRAAFVVCHTPYHKRNNAAHSYWEIDVLS